MKDVLAVSRHVFEVNGIVADARRERHVAARSLFFALCVKAVAGNGVKKEEERADRTRDVRTALSEVGRG